MSELRHTPLYAAHQRLGARFVDFGGWEMPVQYSSIVDEHLAVRKSGGVFDISHMGEVMVTGEGACAFLNQVLTNDAGRLEVGQAQYSIMCREDGGTVDDLYVYRLEEERYFLIVNASRVEADWEWLQAQYDRTTVEGAIQLNNVSDEYAAIAVQGPKVAEIMDDVMAGGSLGGRLVSRATELKKNEVGVFVYNGVTVFVARTGYTGEDGFEIVAPANAMEDIWSHVLAQGHRICLQPAGLGSRDTLRTEACYPLYGHELSESISPVEAGLGFFVAMDKGDFVGRDAMQRLKLEGLTRRCVAFRMTAKSAPPRPHYAIWPDEVGVPEAVGEVTSGTQSPSLSQGIGLGYVPLAMAKAGTKIWIEIRGKRVPAEIVRKPIYRKPAEV